MNKIYDNGALLVGNISDIIAKIENQDENLLEVDKDEILKHLYELKYTDNAEIVCINYCYNGTCYDLDYWTRGDVIK